MSDSNSPVPRRTFIELYCEQNDIEAPAFEKHVLRRVLYPHVCFFGPFVRAAWSDHFAADLDLVRSVALVRRMRDLSAESDAFAHHPANVGALRHIFRLRASTTRLHRLVRTTLHPEPAHTTPPFVQG
ncbi:MAG: hypothetical protein H7067_17865 [Burkholderiales bacterium]|nr:hypothetical protein [Opitutaceae bacterium]